MKEQIPTITLSTIRQAIKNCGIKEVHKAVDEMQQELVDQNENYEAYEFMLECILEFEKKGWPTDNYSDKTKSDNKQLLEIKRAIDICELANSYGLGLAYNGKTSCIFHADGKNPNLVFFKDSCNFHCFSCKETGDCFKLVMTMEKCSFPEAVKILSDKAGIKTKREPKSIHVKIKLEK